MQTVAGTAAGTVAVAAAAPISLDLCFHRRLSRLQTLVLLLRMPPVLLRRCCCQRQGLRTGQVVVAAVAPDQAAGRMSHGRGRVGKPAQGQPKKKKRKQKRKEGRRWAEGRMGAADSTKKRRRRKKRRRKALHGDCGDDDDRAHERERGRGDRRRHFEGDPACPVTRQEIGAERRGTDPMESSVAHLRSPQRMVVAAAVVVVAAEELEVSTGSLESWH